MPDSRYRPGDAPDYSHRFHAGNVGDVWKHCALIALLEAAAEQSERVVYLDTHAGEGAYALGATGEWSEGIGRLWDASDVAENGLFDRYLSCCRRLGAGDERPLCYPGSPLLARDLLGNAARLKLWEREESACERLEAAVGADSRIDVAHGDGLAGLADEVSAAEQADALVVAFIDPPWTQKADWTEIPDAVVQAAKRSRRAWLALWYPVKSLTRPNAMLERLSEAGVDASMVELITTPLEHKRNRLNGSGVLLVRAPDSVLSALAAVAPWLGSRCATQAGRWSFRMQAWPPR